MHKFTHKHIPKMGKLFFLKKYIDWLGVLAINTVSDKIFTWKYELYAIFLWIQLTNQ